MSNQYVFNDRLPLAPLKIAALESCRDLAQKVNDHIVNFRRNDTEELIRLKEDHRCDRINCTPHQRDHAVPLREPSA